MSYPISPKDIPQRAWLTAKALAACRKGVTAIEFAFVAPVFLLMICGIIEFSVIAFVSTVMESATGITSRLGKTGYAANGLTRQQQIIATINNQTAGLLDPNKLTVTTSVYSSFSNIGQPEPCINPVNPPCSGIAGTNYVDVNGNGQWDSDMGAAGLGNSGDTVVYIVSYPWSILTPMVGAIIGSTYNITARTVVRNEPFTNGIIGR